MICPKCHGKGKLYSYRKGPITCWFCVGVGKVRYAIGRARSVIRHSSRVLQFSRIGTGHVTRFQGSIR